MALDIGQIRSLTHTSGFLNTDHSGNAVAYGTNFLSKLVARHPPTGTGNLRNQIIDAMKKEYGKEPEGARFVKDMEAILKKENADQKPLDLKQIKSMISRGDEMVTAYSENQSLRRMDQTRGFANLVTSQEKDGSLTTKAKMNFNAIMSDQLRGTSLGDHVDNLAMAEGQRRGFNPDVEPKVERFLSELQKNEPTLSKDEIGSREASYRGTLRNEVAIAKTRISEIRDGLISSLATKSVLFHVRSEIMSASNLGTEALRNNKQPGVVGTDLDGLAALRIGEHTLPDLVKSGVAASGTLGHLHVKLESLDNLEIASDVRNRAMMAAFQKPDQPLEAFLAEQGIRLPASA